MNPELISNRPTKYRQSALCDFSAGNRAHGARRARHERGEPYQGIDLHTCVQWIVRVDLH